MPRWIFHRRFFGGGEFRGVGDGHGGDLGGEGLAEFFRGEDFDVAAVGDDAALHVFARTVRFFPI